MDCKKAERLIPLFVEADLDTVEMQQVTAHLATCSSCRNLSSEFHASQSLLHSACLPVFDEAIFTNMRVAVQQEIARPTFAAWVTQFWNWKAAFAASAAMLILVSSFIFVARFKARQEAAVSNTSEPIITAAACCGTGSVSDLSRKQRRATNQSEAGRSRSPYRNRLTTSAKRAAGVNAEPQAQAPTNSPAFVIETATAASEIAFSVPETELPEPEMLRMEFQTADPNIKIIWLTPKEPVAMQSIPEPITR